MAKKKDTENAKRAEPQSDMETLYYEVGNRLEDEGINVNVDTLPKIELDNRRGLSRCG